MTNRDRPQTARRVVLDVWDVVAITAIIFCVAFPVGILLFRDRWESHQSRLAFERKLREHPEQVPGTPEFAARFDAPEFDQLERHFGRPMPSSYYDLYNDKDFVSRGQIRLTPPGEMIEEDWMDISYFIPADLLAQEQFWEGLLEFWGENRFRWLFFAREQDGDCYFLDLGAGDAVDGPVYRLNVYESAPTKLADSLREVLNWKRDPIEWDD